MYKEKTTESPQTFTGACVSAKCKEGLQLQEEKLSSKSQSANAFTDTLRGYWRQSNITGTTSAAVFYLPTIQASTGHIAAGSDANARYAS